MFTIFLILYIQEELRSGLGKVAQKKLESSKKDEFLFRYISSEPHFLYRISSGFCYFKLTVVSEMYSRIQNKSSKVCWKFCLCYLPVLYEACVKMPVWPFVCDLNQLIGLFWKVAESGS